jgi:hypothetical protein
VLLWHLLKPSRPQLGAFGVALLEALQRAQQVALDDLHAVVDTRLRGGLPQALIDLYAANPAMAPSVECAACGLELPADAYSHCPGCGGARLGWGLWTWRDVLAGESAGLSRGFPAIPCGVAAAAVGPCDGRGA